MREMCVKLRFLVWNLDGVGSLRFGDLEEYREGGLSRTAREIGIDT